MRRRHEKTQKQTASKLKQNSGLIVKNTYNPPHKYLYSVMNTITYSKKNTNKLERKK